MLLFELLLEVRDLLRGASPPLSLLLNVVLWLIFEHLFLVAGLAEELSNLTVDYVALIVSLCKKYELSERLLSKHLV